MSWFKFGRTKAPQPETTAVDAPCLHAALAPRWDRGEDIGHEDRATSFRCDSCGTTFTPAEERHMREDEAERLREMLKP
jgi:hypothetical protein